MTATSTLRRPGAPHPPPGGRARRRSVSLAAWLGVCVLLAVPGASTGPVEDPATSHVDLLQRVRDNVARDAETIRTATYTLERRTYEVSFVGKVSNGDVNTYEVSPSPFEPGRPLRRLVAVNGVRLSPERIRREEEKARSEALARLRAEERETAPAKALRVRDQNEDAEKQRERLRDIERVFRFTPAGEETVEGIRTVVFDLTPRPDAQTGSDIGRHLTRLKGRMWVVADQGQMVRADFVTIGDITVGLGVIGRVSTGSRMTYRRARTATGAWAPAEARFQGTGRTLMLIPFNIETWAKYADIRPTPPSTPSGQPALPPR